MHWLHQPQRNPAPVFRESRPEPPSHSSIMVAHLRDPELRTDDFVDDAVFAVDPSRPPALKRMAQWLGFADAAERLAYDFLQQLVDALELLRIGRLPIQILLPCLGRKHQLRGGHRIRRLSTSAPCPCRSQAV